jgi:hypothetical protein
MPTKKKPRKKRAYKSVKQVKSTAAAKRRIVKINKLADEEQKKAGYTTKNVKKSKLSRKEALKRAGRKYKKSNK